MDTVVGWIGLGLLALVGVSVVVACWEHTVGQRRPLPRPGPDAERRTLRLDIDLGQLPPAGGQTAQRVAFGAALGSMVHGPSDPVSPGMHSWIETRPMVGLGTGQPIEAGAGEPAGLEAPGR